MNHNEPSSWPVVHFADVGTSELFVHRLDIEIPKLLDASSVLEPERAKTKEAIAALVNDGLLPAFLSLRKIRALASQPPLPVLNWRLPYDDFMGTLWQGYKNFLQKATKEMGFDIGFFFQEEPKFDSGIVSFLEKNPAVPKDLGRYLRNQRDGWQGKLRRVRNEYLEHHNIEWGDVKEVYCVEQAEKFFESAWTAAETILACLIQSRFWPGWGIEEIPVADRNPNFPDRFRFIRRQPLKIIDPVTKG